MPGAMVAAAFSLATMAPSGRPHAKGLAATMMSGSTTGLVR